MDICCDEFKEKMKEGCIQKDKEDFVIIWKDSTVMAYNWGFLKIKFCPFCGKKLKK